MVVVAPDYVFRFNGTTGERTQTRGGVGGRTLFASSRHECYDICGHERFPAGIAPPGGEEPSTAVPFIGCSLVDHP
jgi:hypothetical protein